MSARRINGILSKYQKMRIFAQTQEPLFPYIRSLPNQSELKTVQTMARHHYQNVLETIGSTPLIKLNRIVEDIPANVFAKVEAYNPGQSAKDRTALYMVEQAEKAGKLKPGGTIVEATSGNTGFSLAMISALKGYRCVLCVTTKASKEKLALLRSLGAEVVICPAEAAPEDPQSYYSQAARIAKETPNAFYLAQNYNLDNVGAHYHSTGPEIWEQTEGKITHYVCCAGTGGTLSGTAKYLKEQNPDVKIIGVDAYGSVLMRYWEVGYLDKSVIKSWKVEGLGKTIIPDNVLFSLIDDFIKVSDIDAAHRTRELARMEALFIGYSAGAALEAVFKIKDQLKPTDNVVVLFPDHGTRYLGKVYDDEWMKAQGFLFEEEGDYQPGESSSSYSYQAVRQKYKAYYRTYRRKYKKYLRQTRDYLNNLND